MPRPGDLVIKFKPCQLSGKLPFDFEFVAVGAAIPGLGLAA